MEILVDLVLGFYGSPLLLAGRTEKEVLEV